MSSALIKSDDQYRSWLQEVSKRFRQSQIKAAVHVNAEMLRFYWSLGKDIAAMSENARYGSGFYQSVSTDLKELFPEVHSFSVTNLKYMRYFYELYPEAGNRPQTVDEWRSFQNRQQLVDGMGLESIFLIPWGHHVVLMNACRDNPQKALFYVRKTIENNWSRAVLLNQLDTDLYERQGKAVTNFTLTLPAAQSDLAQAITKDPYSFDFLTIRDRYDEKELKDALLDNAEKFLLELGTGFAFIGREVRVEIGETEGFIDLLFYHVRLHCYVVVEVKATKFEPGHMGQLGTYVVAVNHQMKTAQDQPTLGLLVCKEMDKVQAQYALESSSQPLGVSSYELTRLVPENFKGSLPTIEEIEAELSGGGNEDHGL